MNEAKEKYRYAAEVVFQRTIKKDMVQQTLPNDLFLESLLYLYKAFERDAYLKKVLDTFQLREKQGNIRFSRTQFFTCLPYSMWQQTGDDKYLEGFIAFANDLKKNLGRDKDGAVVAPDDGRKCRTSVNILQGYAVCMARAGFLTGNREWFDEAIAQFEIYTAILRNNEIGLWHHGRGWSDEPSFVSPGFWNLAQGWCFRGMNEVLACLPPTYLGYEKMLALVKETAQSLIRFQDKTGMWHQLTNRPDSYPETGGTSLIAFYLMKGIRNKWLPEQPFTDAAIKAINAVQNYLTRDGSVSNVSYATDPMRTEEGYRYLPAVTGDVFGAAYFLMACSAPFLDN